MQNLYITMIICRLSSTFLTPTSPRTSSCSSMSRETRKASSASSLFPALSVSNTLQRIGDKLLLRSRNAPSDLKSMILKQKYVVLKNSHLMMKRLHPELLLCSTSPWIVQRLKVLLKSSPLAAKLSWSESYDQGTQSLLILNYMWPSTQK